jgi:hypothetical protein
MSTKPIIVAHENPSVDFIGDYKWIARKRGQTLVFLDESKPSGRPTCVRTWTPRGQTPVMQYSFSWKQLSAIVMATCWQFYFRLLPGSITGPQIVEFLAALTRQIHAPRTSSRMFYKRIKAKSYASILSVTMRTSNWCSCGPTYLNSPRRKISGII